MEDHREKRFPFYSISFLLLFSFSHYLMYGYIYIYFNNLPPFSLQTHNFSFYMDSLLKVFIVSEFFPLCDSRLPITYGIYTCKFHQYLKLNMVEIEIIFLISFRHRRHDYQHYHFLKVPCLKLCFPFQNSSVIQKGCQE